MNNLFWTVFEAFLLVPAWMADKAEEWLGERGEGKETASEPRFTDIFFNYPGLF